MWSSEPFWSVELLLHVTARVLPRLIILSLQGTIVLIVMGGVAHLFRHRSASVRHRLWSLALGSVLVLPMLTQWGPKWHVPSLPSSAIWAYPLHGIQNIQAAVFPVSLGRSSGLVAQAGKAFEPSPMGGLGAREVSSTAGRSVMNVLIWITLLWVVGMLVMATRIVIGLLERRRLTHDATPLTDGDWIRLVKWNTNRLGIRRLITVRLSGQHGIPVTWGLIHPTILLPASALDWPEAQRSTVVMHELAHVRRFDALVQTVVQLATTIFWFNPWIWKAVRHIRLESEHACDDIVLLAGISPVSYANHLVRIARMVHAGTDSSRMIWGTLAMARPAGLETRVLSILNPAVDRRPLCKREISILMAAVGLVTLPAASLRPTTAAAPQAPTSIGRTIGTSGTHQRQSAQPAKQIDTVILSPDKSYWPVAPSCVAVSELSNQTIVRCSWDHMRGSANGLFGDTIYSVSMPRTYPRLTGVSIDMDETMLQMGQAVGMMKDVMAVIRKVGECVSVSYPIAARARPDTHIREGAQCVSLYY